jgi:hypothetical protein
MYDDLHVRGDNKVFAVLLLTCFSLIRRYQYEPDETVLTGITSKPNQKAGRRGQLEK